MTAPTIKLATVATMLRQTRAHASQPGGDPAFVRAVLTCVAMLEEQFAAHAPDPLAFRIACGQHDHAVKENHREKEYAVHSVAPLRPYPSRGAASSPERSAPAGTAHHSE
jgi:hypothetical protein